VLSSETIFSSVAFVDPNLRNLADEVTVKVKAQTVCFYYVAIAHLQISHFKNCAPHKLTTIILHELKIQEIFNSVLC